MITDEDTHRRFARYQANERHLGRTPMEWLNWIEADMPLSTPNAILDANGDPVGITAPDDLTSAAIERQFFATRVPAPDCPHYMAQSEMRAGFTKCERCN